MIMMHHRDAAWQENLATQTFDGSYYLCPLHIILPVVLSIILIVVSVSVLSAVGVCASSLQWNGTKWNFTCGAQRDKCGHLEKLDSNVPLLK